MTQKNRGFGMVALTIVVAIVLVFVVAFVVGLSSKVEDTQRIVKESMGSAGQFPGAPNFPDGASLGKEDIIHNSKKISLNAGDNDMGWKNQTGRTIYIDLVSVRTTGIASSTMTVDVATSSTETIADYSDPFSEIIDSYSLATSSPTDTVIASNVNGGTNGIGVVAVADGEWVSLLLSATAGALCDGSACETATSTSRGFNLDMFIEYFYIR